MIAVTGIGIVSPYGVGLDAFREGFVGYQAVNRSEPPGKKEGGLRTIGCIKDFIPKNHIPMMKARRMSRFSQIALIASGEAWGASGLDVSDDNAKKYGVIVGTGLGSVGSTDQFYDGLVRKGPLETNPILFPETVQNIAAAHISMELGLKGANTTFSQGDIAGEFAIYYAAQLLRGATADAVLVCGADELTQPLISGMRALRLLSDTQRLMPFDKNRDGIVPAEGAASLVMERAEDADRRGARIFGFIRAFGMNSDGVERFAYAGPDSMARAMESALDEFNASPGFISASANSTRELDENEAIAIKSIFRDEVPVTALKSQTGSFMSSGVMKAASALLSIQDGVIPPVFGLRDPDVGGIKYVMAEPMKKRTDTCLINGFSHGGANICILVSGGRKRTGG